MNNATLVLLLQIAGLLHIGLMCAGLAMPKVVNLPVVYVLVAWKGGTP